MLLNDIGRVPTTTLRKINQHLESNYGFKITENVKDQDLIFISETIQNEISELKLKGGDAKGSPEISKRLLVLEGIKTLREFAGMQQFQAPQYEEVVNAMTELVVNEYHCSATAVNSQEAFEDAVRDAMKIYNSSKYRFPDGFEQTVRSNAMAQISPEVNAMPQSPVLEDDLGESPGGKDRNADREWVSHSEAPRSSPKKAINDVFAAHAEERRKGIVHAPAVPGISMATQRRKGLEMRENTNLVKHLRALLETEVSQAEVMMAAKGFAQELQEMVEKIGRLQNEDLPPVTDQMRETYGMESASAFQTQIYGALQSVMDSLYTAKGQVDDAVGNMASTGQVTAAVDMDKDVGNIEGGMGLDDEMGDVAAPDLDNIEDELVDEPSDEFGGAAGEEPLGRAMKEAALHKKVVEMKKIVAKARKLKEAKANSSK